MHAVRLGFVNWGVRKVSGMNGEDVEPFTANEALAVAKNVHRPQLDRVKEDFDGPAGPLPGVQERKFNGFLKLLKVRAENPRRRAPPGRRLGQ
jgi:hypothetical protein